LLNWILICLQAGKIQVIAFQSQGGQQRTTLPLAMAPVIDLDSSWSSSDNAFASNSAFEGIEQDTGDSRASKNSKVYSDATCIYGISLMPVSSLLSFVGIFTTMVFSGLQYIYILCMIQATLCNCLLEGECLE